MHFSAGGRVTVFSSNSRKVLFWVTSILNRRPQVEVLIEPSTGSPCRVPGSLVGGCGVRLIVPPFHRNARAGTRMEKIHVFISHITEEKETALCLKEFLRESLGWGFTSSFRPISRA